MSKQREIQELVCDYCETKFTTEKPNYRPVPCGCGEIMCDVTPFYIRILFVGSKPKNTTFLINGEIIEESEL